jgi:hypothetical protein
MSYLPSTASERSTRHSEGSNATASRVDCFVMMPFAEEFDRIYHDAIRPGALLAAERVGISMSVTRADEYTLPSHITRDIVEMLFRCSCAVADLTDGNPNVFYELGVAHAMGDKTLMITQDVERLPFDLRNYRVLAYSSDDAGLAKLRGMIAASLAPILERKPGSPIPRSNPVSDFAPVRLSDVTVRLPELLALEQRATGEIWILGPDVDIDLRDYAAVMREAIVERSVVYKYILPDTADSDRSWRRLGQALALPAPARSRLRRKVVPEHVIESELVIYDPGGREEAVYLIPPAEDDAHIYIRLPRTRATTVRRRFERLWDN